MSGPRVCRCRFKRRRARFRKSIGSFVVIREREAWEMSIKRLNLWSVTVGVFGLIIALVISAMPINAQLAGANLSGVVSDESGAPIVGAKVSIKNLATGDVREVETNTEGLFFAPNLAPATYDVIITASGFGPVTQKGLVLNVGGEQALDVKMRVGQLAQEVEVNASATNVETTTSAVSATVEEKTVVELPLNGRDWTQLATLQPGVTSVRAQA